MSEPWHECRPPVFPGARKGMRSGPQIKQASAVLLGVAVRRSPVGCFEAGGVVLSHPVSRAVPSALRGLTTVFGMGTGGSPAPWPPATLLLAVLSFGRVAKGQLAYVLGVWECVAECYVLLLV